MGCASSRTQCIHENYSFQAELSDGTSADIQLSEGTYADIQLCVERDSETLCAVKVIECTSKAAQTDARREEMLWKRVPGHPNVLNLLETFADKHYVYFVMERCPHSLQEVLSHKKNQLKESHLLATSREMLLALQHCHSVKVVHRDVTPANFLMGFDGTVKLCGFGCAELETRHGIVGRVGTPQFMSPEMVRGQQYNHKTDMWSLGVVVYLMLYGKCPYQISGDNSSYIKIEGLYLKYEAIAKNMPEPPYVEETGFRKPSLEARGFVQALLHPDPSMRPSANKCFRMEAMLIAYMKSLDTKKQMEIDRNGSMLSAHDQDGFQDSSPVEQIDVVGSSGEDTWTMTDALDMISKLQTRHSQRSEDPWNNKEKSSKDRTGSKSCSFSASTADGYGSDSRSSSDTESTDETLVSASGFCESTAGSVSSSEGRLESEAEYPLRRGTIHL